MKKRRKKEKEIEKKTNIRQNARIKGRKRKIQLENQKELEEIHELIKARWIYI